MALSPGATFGRYEIQVLLGSGGMGEVYRALDSSLGREVAIKVLPEDFSKHPDRLGRFAREARLLASLNHPNIASVHALECTDDRYYLEMELVRGETLSARIERGPIQCADALRLARQMAEALAAAHAQSIVHRDLKPTNVMITPAGVVKVLDFGLAKVVASDSQASSPEPPTLSGATEAGMILGTAAYMSPEQARGEAVDRRTDIWAFGCVLYEALTAQRAFEGPSMSDVIASVLKEQPDWSLVDAVAPPRVQRLVRRCLQKDASRRLHDIADARIEIDDALADPTEGSPTSGVVSGQRSSLAAMGTAVALTALLVGGGTWAAMRTWSAAAPASAGPLARLTITLPAGQVVERGRFTPLAVSPDSRLLVYTAGRRGGQTSLYLRRLDELDARLIAGTEGGNTPFFSPDGRWVAFYADGALKKVSLAGGVPLTISEAPPIWSASWAGSTIVYATTLAGSGLSLVSSDGGEPAQITTPKEDEIEHGYPQILPGGTHVLYSVLSSTGRQLAVASLSDRQSHPIGGGRAIGAGAHYVASGHLVFAQSGGLVAVRFDASRQELEGAPVPLLERIETSRFGSAYFAVASGAGSLVYLPASGGAAARELLRVDRDGRGGPIVDARLAYEHPVISPDGKRVALTVASETGSDVWLIDLERGTRIRLTSGDTSAFPVWSPDGSRVAYQSTAPGPWNLYAKAIERTGDTQPLVASSSQSPAWPSSGLNLLPGTVPTLSGVNPQFPMSWAPRSANVAFHERKPSGERDIWIVGPDRTPAPFLLTPFDEHSPKFSPNGNWLAYVSNESGQSEVYVEPFPGPGTKSLVSTDSGTDPVWSRDGRELFYRQNDQLMVVSVGSSATFSASRPRRLFEARYEADDNAPNYDVSPDGHWFVMTRREQAPPPGELFVVFNWFGEIAARTAAVQ